MMYLIFGWNDGQAKGGFGDFLGLYIGRDRADDAFDYATGSWDRVDMVAITGASWNHVAGFHRGIPTGEGDRHE